MMQSLDKELRNALERTVKAARTVAESAAHAAVEQLGVGHEKPEAFLGDSEKALRNRLRTHGKQLGDARDSKSSNPTYGRQEVRHLVQEVAYQHWHRMLFARFLADNNLLMYEGVPVTIEECDELALDEGANSGWELAGKLAARMLPQVFKPGSPVFELNFAPEHQSELERLLKDLPVVVFKASDSLGWVYQFWQADNKDRINKSGVKIGADELPAVTQLFTEPYMVAFLLHNSLGAWWATRHPGKACPMNLDYFRTLDDGTPAAGKFEGWPSSLADFKLLDPCCGSGHFLVAAFLMLVPMRMAAEGLSAKEAVNRVLVENIHGLELDPRCVEIAVFAVAMEAWRYPDTPGKPLGVREIPAPNIACCGLKVAAKAQEWEALVPDEAPNAAYVRQELRRLHTSFSDAPLLGSLLDPARSLKNDLATCSNDTLRALLGKALATERRGNRQNEDHDRQELALSAEGLLEAARLLEARYHLVITNVPYRKRGNHSDSLKAFCESHYPTAKYDLANVFLERCLELSEDRGGVVQIVMPQNWLFLITYKHQRIDLLKRVRWNFLARLGSGAFETISGEVVNVILLTQTRDSVPPDFMIRGINASGGRTSFEKAASLRARRLLQVSQAAQLNNPDARVSLDDASDEELLSKYANSYQGITTGDNRRFIVYFWELEHFGSPWMSFQSTGDTSAPFTGREQVFRWEDGKGVLASSPAARIQGMVAWNKWGVAVRQMGTFPATLNSGSPWDMNSATIVPKEPNKLAAIWCFCSSPNFMQEVRQVDQAIKVTSATMAKMPFSLDQWQSVAEERYPKGLPEPYSDDPKQWIFHGHPLCSTDPLQVAVARLVGYTWPAEADDKMALSDEARMWTARSKSLSDHADKNGIVCIPPVSRGTPAGDRLINLLAAAYGEAWSKSTLAQLLAAVDNAGKSLETWLRDRFFTQHCALFGSRPFVWHVWDGLRDGFAALLNYHRLDYKALEALIYTYLGDWIGVQKRDVEKGVDGAQEKLAAAEGLKRRLELILGGETPHDIFVRWKPIEEQPVGWNPDLNDGVRVNIRPFLSVSDVGRRGSGVLRDKPKSLHWETDPGKDDPSAPWYELGLQYRGEAGDRINDHHLSLADKRKARDRAK
jgi:hypothetical protein